MTVSDSPAAAVVRELAAEFRGYRGTEAAQVADALDGVLADLDEARGLLAARGGCTHLHGPLRQLAADNERLRAELAALPEWRCPGCGATTRARMADRVPRVWLEGDEVPAGVVTVVAGQVMRPSPCAGVAAWPCVEVHVPDYAATVDAERERRTIAAGHGQ